MSRDTWIEFVSIIILLAIVVAIVAGPFITIWSLNVLFQLHIPVTFRTWCATAWLLAVLYVIRIIIKRD